MKSKRGLAEVVGYVLLVVLAIGLSVGVYSYLKVFVPKETPQCPDDIYLILQHYSYNKDTAELSITIKNRGLFNVSGAYIRFGPEERAVRKSINQEKERFDIPLSPGQTLILDNGLTEKLDLSGISELQDIMILEIQPAILNKKFGLVLCERAVITQKVTAESAV